MSDATSFTHTVRLEDGRTFEAKSDQRDIAAFELEPFGCAFFEVLRSRPFVFARYMAWRGSKRAKLHSYTWEEWGEACIDVAETEDEQPVDPGQPVASAGA